MIPFLRYVEVAVYSFFNFAPYIFIALYPFRHSLRFSRRTTLPMLAIVTVIQIMTGLWSGIWQGDGCILSIISTLVYAGTYFLAVRTPFGKSLFTLLMLSNIANFVVMASKCIEGFFFPALALQNYRWSFSVCMFFVELLVLIPLFLYTRSTYASILEKDIARPIWRFIWTIPTTFYVVWYYHLYNNQKTALEVALDPANTVFLLIINIGAQIVYHTVIQHINVISQNVQLMEKNHALTMQALQYENLQDRITQTRRIKHDIRHNVLMLQMLIQDGRYDEAMHYLKQYEIVLPDDRSVLFCKHYAANALLQYFDQQARNHGISFHVKVDISENIGVSDNILSVVLGNLLENAVEACCNVAPESRSIEIRSICEGGTILFKIRNTYCGKLKREKNGLFLSTKHSGRGIGLASVRSILKANGGMIELEPGDIYFTVTVMLMLD